MLIESVAVVSLPPRDFKWISSVAKLGVVAAVLVAGAILLGSFANMTATRQAAEESKRREAADNAPVDLKITAQIEALSAPKPAVPVRPSASYAARVMADLDGNIASAQTYNAWLTRLLAIVGDSRERRAAQIDSASDYLAQRGHNVSRLKILSDYVVVAESTPAMRNYSFEETLAAATVTYGK